MEENPYNHFSSEEMILRDYLAADRTTLANERTILAYIRTAFTFFIAGVSFIQFFDNLLIQQIGVLLIPTGILILIVGLVQFNRMKQTIHHIKEFHREQLDTTPPSSHPHSKRARKLLNKLHTKS